MKTEINSDGLAIVIEENLVADNMNALRAMVQSALEESDHQAVIFDLSKVSFLDSSGLALIIGAFKSCEKKGVRFRIDVGSADVLRIFKTCKLDSIMEIRKVESDE